MPEQLFLPFDAPPSALDRLFFAVLSCSDTALQIAERITPLRDEHGLKGRPIASQRLHVSLHGLGDYPGLPEILVELARRAGASVSMPPFEIAFDPVMSFNRKDRKRPLVLRVGSDLAVLETFHRLVGEAMKKAGLGRWVAPRFTPHMTLLYDNRIVREQAIEPIRLTVSDFALVHSLVGRSRYIELARWPLCG